MKSTKLIEILQQLDPTGEAEITIDNADIYTIVKDYAFIDGCVQKLHFDEEMELMGSEICTEGTKIELVPLSIKDALILVPDLPIKLSVHNNVMLEHYIKIIEEWKEGSEYLHEQLKNELRQDTP